MARPPLPSFLTGRPSAARVREMLRTTADTACDVFHPMIAVGRGLRLQAAWLRAWWDRTPKDRRGPPLVIAAAAVLFTGFLTYGPTAGVIGLLCSAAWAGRDRGLVQDGPTEAESVKLQSLYEALVPYLSVPGDPRPLYSHDGDWGSVFSDYAFEGGRPARLHLRYPAYFTDGEQASRARVEQVLYTKCGRGREYRFAWDEEENRLTVTTPAPLPTDIRAQRFITAPGETVLGFTDSETVQRTVPVRVDDETRDAPPVVWRTGAHSTEPHLLALGQPGSGTTTLIRSIALQALDHGDILVIDGAGQGEHACLAGRVGVLALESDPAAVLAALEWAVHETERRLTAVNRARQSGRTVPEDTRRPLWILLDRPTALSRLAQAEGRQDPQELLDVPLRHGRVANVTVVVADHLDAAETLAPAVTAYTRVRVALGPLTPEACRTVLGAPPCTTSSDRTPAGRGYARLGSGPAQRLQVPATPDPYDEETGEARRAAVLALLPPSKTPPVTKGPRPVAEAPSGKLLALKPEH